MRYFMKILGSDCRLLCALKLKRTPFPFHGMQHSLYPRSPSLAPEHTQEENTRFQLRKPPA